MALEDLPESDKRFVNGAKAGFGKWTPTKAAERMLNLDLDAPEYRRSAYAAAGLALFSLRGELLRQPA